MDIHVGKWLAPLSEQEMLEMYKVNTDFREPSRLKHNNRPTTVKRADWEVAQVLNHQTTLELKPKYNSLIPEWSVDILEAMLAKQWVEHKQWERTPTVEWNILGGVLFSDLHLDRSDIENSSIEKRIEHATECYKRAIDRVLMFNPSNLLIGNAWDTLNTDGRYSTSSGKHFQQNSVSEHDAFKYVLEWSAEMLEYMQQFRLPIEYAQVSWNHDELSAWHLGIALQAYFKDSNINIVVEKHRFYKEWGEILIMLSHWQSETPKRVLEIAVNEFVRKKYNQMYSYMWHKHIKEMQQVWPMVNKRVWSLVPPSEWEAKFWYKPYKWMSGFVRDKEQWEIADLKG